MSNKEEQFDTLVDYLFDRFTEKAAGSTPTTTWGHGPGGVYSHPGLSQQVFNAMLLPHMGLQKVLPVRTSNEMNPLFGIMTGVTANSGNNPTNVCDDFPSAGLAKLCMHTAVFGRIGLNTRVFNIDRAGESTNRGEFMDLRLIGQPVSQGPGPSIPGGDSNPLQKEATKALFEFAAGWCRTYGPLLYGGNPSNNTAGGGYKEFYGLDSLINTGYRDAETGDACAAADSIIQSYGNANIADANADIVGVVQDIFFRLRHIGYRAGLGNCKWVISMPYGMFYRLSEVWAYYYITRSLDALTFNSAVQITHPGEAAIKLRDEFRGNLETREGQFLMIDGQRIDVVLDDNITTTEYTPGVFSSDIYIVPLTVLGGTPVTFMENFNFTAPGGAMEMARLMAPGDSYYTTDNGAYLWHKKPPTNFCVELLALQKPRLIVRTPYLAARITDVNWAPLTQHERSAFTDNSYFVNGGRTDRLGYGPSFYSPTS